MARTVQSAVRPSIPQTGSRTFPAPVPRKALFIRAMPWVSGKTLTILRMASGMTSIGSVVPEKTSMGKRGSRQ